VRAASKQATTVPPAQEACSDAFRHTATRFNPLEHPVIFTNPLRLTTSSWIQHLPFGMFLIELLQPRIVVELGTHYGVSYCGFCQAVKALRTDTRCYAVDNWQGDEHNGAYGTDVYDDLRQHHDPRYGDFSQLLKLKFDDALPYFADGSIDLLHIDGYHTYESVRHDFEIWLPKLSERGVVLVHDINERDRQFGVWRLWDELRHRYRTFDMLHEHGLGIAAVGGQVPAALDLLLGATPEETTQLREFFHLVGLRLTSQMQYAEFVSRLQHVKNLEAVIVERENDILGAKAYIASLREALEQARTVERTAVVTDSTPPQAGLDDLQARVAGLEGEVEKLAREQHEHSTCVVSLERARTDK
jgi:hypothetical protein